MHPFDAAASGYDTTFSATRLGRWLRALVWERLAAHIAPGDRVLELGCGTGEDAVWMARRGALVTATDASEGMLAATRAKALAAGVGGRVAAEPLDMRAPQGWAARCAPGAFDAALSNFGALNCAPDRGAVADLLARAVRPGGRVALVVMGPICAWEIGWHLARGRGRDALRRLRAGALAHVADGARIPVWYPSPGRLRAELAPAFEQIELAGVGALLPPSYMERVVERHPDLFAGLALAERRLAARAPWPWLSDHYLAVFERRTGGR